MDRLILQLKDWWAGADKTTKVVSIVGSLLFVAVIYLTVTLSSQSKMQPISGGMNDSEKSAAYEELNKKGFKVELSGTGDVLVPAGKDYSRARMALAAANKLPKGGGSGFGLDKIGPFETPNVEQEKLLKSQESDIAASIETMEGVAGATVHIAAGKESAVMEEKTPPSAVVSLTENSPGSVSKEAGRAIANLIQGSVTGLEQKAVKVITNSGHTLFDGADQDSEGGAASTKLETERTESKARTQQLQAQLDMVFGRGTTIADIKVAYNMNPTRIVKHDVTPTTNPLRIESEVEKANAGSKAPVASGVAGAESNNPANPAAAEGTKDDAKSYNGATKSSEFGASTKDTTETKTPELVGETISVLVDKVKVKNLSALTNYVNGTLGAKLDTPGFKATVVPTEFNNTDADLAKKAADEASGQQKMQTMLGILPVVALIGVGFLLSKSLPKLVPSVTKSLDLDVAKPIESFSTIGANPFGQPQQVHHIQDYSALAGYGSGSLDPQIIEHRYTMDGGRAGVGTAEVVETEQEKEARQTEEVLRALGIDENDDVDIESIKQKLNIPLERIKRMAEKKPELVATLLKSWMMEDHR